MHRNIYLLLILLYQHIESSVEDTVTNSEEGVTSPSLLTKHSKSSKIRTYIPLNSLSFKAEDNEYLFGWMYQGPSVLRQMIKNSKLGSAKVNDTFQNSGHKNVTSSFESSTPQPPADNGRESPTSLDSSVVQPQYLDEENNENNVAIPKLSKRIEDINEGVKTNENDSNSFKEGAPHNSNYSPQSADTATSNEEVFEHIDLNEYTRIKKPTKTYPVNVKVEVQKNSTGRPVSNSDVIWLFTTRPNKFFPTSSSSSYSTKQNFASEPSLMTSSTKTSSVVTVAEDQRESDYSTLSTIPVTRVTTAAEDLERFEDVESPNNNYTKTRKPTKTATEKLNPSKYKLSTGTNEKGSTETTFSLAFESTTESMTKISDSTFGISEPTPESTTLLLTGFSTKWEENSSLALTMTMTPFTDSDTDMINTSLGDDKDDFPSLQTTEMTSTLDPVSSTDADIMSNTPFGFDFNKIADSEDMGVDNVESNIHDSRINVTNEFFPINESSPVVQLNVWNYLGGHLHLTKTHVLPSGIVNIINKPPSFENNKYPTHPTSLLSEDHNTEEPPSPDTVKIPSYDIHQVATYFDKENAKVENPFSISHYTENSSHSQDETSVPPNLYEFILNQTINKNDTESAKIAQGEKLKDKPNDDKDHVKIILDLEHNIPIKTDNLFVPLPVHKVENKEEHLTTEPPEYTSSISVNIEKKLTATTKTTAAAITTATSATTTTDATATSATTTTTDTTTTTTDTTTTTTSTTSSSVKHEPDETPNYPSSPSILQVYQQNNNLNSNLVNTQHTNQHIVNINNPAPILYPFGMFQNIGGNPSEVIPENENNEHANNSFTPSAVISKPDNKTVASNGSPNTLKENNANSDSLITEDKDKTTSGGVGNSDLTSHFGETATSGSVQKPSDNALKDKNAPDQEPSLSNLSDNTNDNVLKNISPEVLVHEYMKRVSNISKLFSEDDVTDPEIASMIENLALQSLLSYFLGEESDVRTSVNDTHHSTEVANNAESEIIIEPPLETTIGTVLSEISEEQPLSDANDSLDDYKINILSHLIADSIFEANDSQQTFPKPNKQQSPFVTSLESLTETFIPYTDYVPSFTSTENIYNENSNQPVKNYIKIPTRDAAAAAAAAAAVVDSDVGLENFLYDEIDELISDYYNSNYDYISVDDTNEDVQLAKPASFTDSIKNSFTKVTQMISGLVPSGSTFRSCLKMKGCTFALASSLAIGALAFPFVVFPFKRRKKRMYFEESRIFYNVNSGVDGNEKLKEEFQRILTFLAMNEGEKGEDGIVVMKGNIIKYLEEEYKRLLNWRKNGSKTSFVRNTMQ